MRGPKTVCRLKTKDESPSFVFTHCQCWSQPATEFCGCPAPGPSVARATQFGPEVDSVGVALGVAVRVAVEVAVEVGVCVGVAVRVGVIVGSGVSGMHCPLAKSHAARKTGMQPPPQAPAIGGPQAGRSH